MASSSAPGVFANCSRATDRSLRFATSKDGLKSKPEGKASHTLPWRETKAARECFFYFAHLPFGGAFQRFHGPRVIKVKDGIELIGQSRIE